MVSQMGHDSQNKSSVLLRSIRGTQEFQRKQLATNKLYMEARKKGTTIALLQEPYTGSIGKVKREKGVRIFQAQYKGEKPIKAAIAVFYEHLNVIHDQSLNTENMTVTTIKAKDWQPGLISVYFEDTAPLEPYINTLKEIIGKLETKKIIIGGDVNAWNPWWGSVREERSCLGFWRNRGSTY